MYSDGEAEKLLQMPKHIDGEGRVYLNQGKNRVNLYSEDGSNKFILDIYRNKKIEFKLSLHHQENQTHVALLRVDFKGRHTNPAGGNRALPEDFKPYIGKCFDINEPHIHCYVAGYKPLVWALPIGVYGFRPSRISHNGDYVEAITEFGRVINVIDEIEIQDSLL